MSLALQLARRVLVAAAFVLPAAVHASPITYDAFLEGSGIAVYSATSASTGSGAWSGTLADSPFPVPTHPLSLLTVVNFTFDTANNLLSGDFEFTSALDFSSTILGLISGSFLSGDFDNGGQLFLNYDIRGGTGSFSGANGYLISLWNTAPTGGGFGAFAEVATGQFSVPAPATVALVSLGLLGLLWQRRVMRNALAPGVHNPRRRR